MFRDVGFEFSAELSEIFLAPQVADFLFAAQSEVGPICGDARRCSTAVEEADCLGAVFHVLGPDFEIANFRDATGLPAERILIYLEDFIIGQKAQREVVQLRHITTDEQRRIQQTPEADVRELFVG